MSDKEKTLKESTFVKTSVDEKVKRARKVIQKASPHIGPLWTKILKEALTALEERVEELEKLLEIERKHHENSGGF